MGREEVLQLEELAVKIRKSTLTCLSKVKAGHIGGSMSMVELMAVLYGKVMRIDPKKPQWVERDWLIVSKGHCGPAVYAALATKGYFKEDELLTVNQGGTSLPSHCDMNKTLGIDMSTGSLGQGMSSAIGIAWGHQYRNRDNYTYLILGDGECDEGQVWEGALFAPQQKLDHLIAFVDCNEKQLDGYTKEICDLGDLRKKFEEFGWDAQECEGHNVEKIVKAIERAKSVKGKPHMIILHTIKGKGCSFTENIYYNHHVKFSEVEYAQAMERLDEQLSTIREMEV